MLGGLLGVYQGHHTVLVHQDITKVPITWQACVARYAADVALGDYEGVREMLQPRGIWSTSPPSMKQRVSSTLKAFLIDTLLANPALNERLAKEVLEDMGITEPQDAVFPMVLSMRDYLMSPRRNQGLMHEKTDHASECLFDSTEGMQVQDGKSSIKGCAHQDYSTDSHTIWPLPPRSSLA